MSKQELIIKLTKIQKALTREEDYEEIEEMVYQLIQDILPCEVK